MEKTLDLINRIIDEDYRNPINHGWIEHGKCVGQTGAIIAEALGLDATYVYILGAIHDIGKRNTRDVQRHDILGYRFLKSLGIDDKYAAVCLTHSYLNNDVNCVAGGMLPRDDFRTEYIKNHHYSEEELIINLCDLMCKDHRMTLEARMIDLLSRKGFHDNSAYHLKEALKLKDYFDRKIPCGVYHLFPDLTALTEVGITSFEDLPEPYHLTWKK